MKRLQAALDNAKQALAKRLKLLVGKIDINLPTEKLTTDSEVRNGMISDMMGIRADQIASAQRIASLEAIVQKVDAQLVGVPAQQIKYAELMRESDVAANALSA